MSDLAGLVEAYMKENGFSKAAAAFATESKGKTAGVRLEARPIPNRSRRRSARKAGSLGWHGALDALPSCNPTGDAACVS
jgi:hypothetical protein